MNSLFIVPVILFLGTFVNLFLDKKSAKVWPFLLIGAGATLFNSGLLLPEYGFSYLGLDLQPAKLDQLSFLLINVFFILGFINLIYSYSLSSKREDNACLFYLSSAIGLTLTADLFSFFVFWELLTIAAVLVILCSKLQPAAGAAVRYFTFHVIGGLILLIGIVGCYLATDSIVFRPLVLGSFQDTWYAWLILIGIGINVAFPLLHTWVVDAYPEASPWGAVWLSALTTKTAAYALIKFFPGESILIWIGAVMMVFPVFYAVIENNLRRVLSYSLINQVGIIVTGIGLGTSLSLAGASAHIVTDIFFKGLLFMSMGAVLYRTGFQKATQLGGLYKYMPITTFFCIIGALSISAFPLFSGFVSKSMIVTAAAESHQVVLWFILLFASAAVLEHAGIKVPFFAFFGHDSGLKVKEAPKCMLIAMGIVAAICILLGVMPETFYAFLPYEVDYQPYTMGHVITQLQLLVFAVIAFILMLLAGIYPPEKKAINLDIDYFYRRIFRYLANKLASGTVKLNNLFDQEVHQKLTMRVQKVITEFPGNFLSIFIKSHRQVHQMINIGTVSTSISLLVALIIFLIFLILF